jgi:hypothetical protein
VNHEPSIVWDVEGIAGSMAGGGVASVLRTVVADSLAGDC